MSCALQAYWPYCRGLQVTYCFVFCVCFLSTCPSSPPKRLCCTSCCSPYLPVVYCLCPPNVSLYLGSQLSRAGIEILVHSIINESLSKIHGQFLTHFGYSEHFPWPKLLDLNYFVFWIEDETKVLNKWGFATEFQGLVKSEEFYIRKVW